MEGRIESNPFNSAIEDLQRYIVEQHIKEDELRRQLFELQNETRKAKRAIEILTDRKVNENRAKTKAKTSRDQWIPSQPKVDAVFSVVTQDPQTVPQISKLAGVSHETTRRVLNHLRLQDRVRMAGVVRAGKSNQKAHSFALMPSEGNNGNH